MTQTHTDLTIRNALNTDTPAIVELWDRCGLSRAWNDPHRDIARAASEPSTRLLVAEQAERLIGTAMVGYDGHRGWLYYLGVDPAHRGAGCGTALMAAAETHLRAIGCPKLMFMVRAGQPAIERWYERQGYEQADVTVFGRRLIADD